MYFRSTRNSGTDSTSFTEALFRGLAPDGGLYHPTSEPDLRALIRSFGEDLQFADLAAAMIQGLFPEEYDAQTARTLSLEAFPFAPVLRELEPGIVILELFHGPSCAFKDFGASFLAAAMERELGRRGERAVILTATSGDTGSAVAHAFHGRDGIDVVILYPSGRVSPLQEQQLTTLGDNVLALEVDGSFDDCQRMAKEAFVDPQLRERLPLSSANSINVGRLIPQSFYYIWAFAQLRETYSDKLAFCVPSGNFGNLTAGMLAWRWGMPVADFIAATNANDVVPEYLATRLYRPRPSVKTLANAMDVGDPSNFERLRAIFADGVLDIGSVLSGYVVDDPTIAGEMRRVYEEHGVFVCPHTAAGIHAARRRIAESSREDTIVVTLATADAGKFVEIAEQAIGATPPVPERIARLLDLPKHAVSIAPDLGALRTLLMDRYAVS